MGFLGYAKALKYYYRVCYYNVWINYWDNLCKNCYLIAFKQFESCVKYQRILETRNDMTNNIN